jgi:hypothetical protein
VKQTVQNKSSLAGVGREIIFLGTLKFLCWRSIKSAALSNNDLPSHQSRVSDRDRGKGLERKTLV